MSGTARPRVRLVDVLRDREVAGLTAGAVLSEWGDHVARVALALLLLRAYDSALLAGLVFAVGCAPGVLAALLGPLADRRPRRSVLLACDLARAGLVALLALGSVRDAPVLALLVLLLLAELFSAPFIAARDALLGDILPDPARYYAASGLLRVLRQVNQVLGLLLGGAVVALVGPETGLMVDAASFLLSGLLVLALVRRRPAALAHAAAGARGFAADLVAGARLIRADRRRRAVLAVGWGATVFLIAPEGVALAYGRAHHGGSLSGALLLASVPFGAAVGAALVARRPPADQIGLVVPLAAASATLLLPTAVDPPVPLAALLWALSGACQGFMVTLISTLVLLTPAQARGRVGGFAMAGFSAATACSLAVSGWLADHATPAFAVTVAGALGLGLLGLTSRTWPEAALRRAVLTAEARAAAAEPPAGRPVDVDDHTDAAGARVPAPGEVPPAAIALPEPRTAAVTSSEPV
jgi:MFS family permease